MSNKDKNIKNLTKLQYHVTKENGTEPAFNNEYWDNKKEGIYVDIISKEPLFSSLDKFDSGTGWPSFTKPINKTNIVEKIDNSNNITRIEVRSNDNSHLGHLFNDGPIKKGGKRYCINSASLEFIPQNRLIDKGYSQYLSLFVQNNQKAYLAGGCFWGMQEIFRQYQGIVKTKVGYSGGNIKNPTYEIISQGNSNHAESIEIEFDEKKINYENILKFFFTIHDPTTLNQQGNDIGSQYRSAIFYIDKEQQEITENLIKKLNKNKIFKNKIVTQIQNLDIFYPAEDYHQDYLQKIPDGYNCHYIRNIKI